MRHVVIPSEAYPLAWPEGTPRTKHPRPSSFARGSHRDALGRRTAHSLSYGDGLAEVRAELQRLGARTAVISTNLPLRIDGQPSASGSVARGDHGAAVYWTERVGGVLVPHVMTCDRWNHLAHNLHAIALSIEALRGLDRWGAVRREQAFAGFRELPSGDGAAPDMTPVARPWREVLGGFPTELDAADLLALAKARHRRLIAEHHPDRGGDVAVAAELNKAMDEAAAELVGG